MSKRPKVVEDVLCIECTDPGACPLHLRLRMEKGVTLRNRLGLPGRSSTSMKYHRCVVLVHRWYGRQDADWDSHIVQEGNLKRRDRNLDNRFGKSTIV